MSETESQGKDKRTARAEPTVLAEYPSSTNPMKTYKVLMGADFNVYCTCPAWRFQKNKGLLERSCKHIERFTGKKR